MKQFRLYNNITGWAVFVFALVVYALTMERTVSYWDCGEYISAAAKLEVVHPSGSPLHAMVGRLFTMFTGVEADAAAVNFLSATSSAFTVLFFFWSITMLGLRLYKKQGLELTQPNALALLGGGVVGAMAITFLDSFWFSAVEGEVYALSAVFASAILWAILRWDSDDTPHSSRWLVLIALLTGLGAGVHLLHLLALPTVAFVYYFKNYEITPRGVLAAFLGGAILVGIMLFGFLDWWVRIGAWFDKPFVNDWGLPFWSGFLFYAALFAVGAILLQRYAARNGKPVLQLGMMAAISALVGLSCYAFVPIRAVANPPINMNKPEDAFTFHSYLKRDQYGSRPLFYGPQFTATPMDQQTSVRWGKGKADDGKVKYIEVGKKVKYDFRVNEEELRSYGYPQDEIDRMKKANKMVLFPRMGSWQQGDHKDAYRDWLDLEEDELPTYGDNIRFFLKYQMGYMYWRYLMWNFSGRQDDIQGHIQRGQSNGNWITGFDFIDKNRPGYNSYESSINKARNKYFMVPFVLALIGMVFHFSKEKKGAWIIMIFFLFMGVGNLINSNEPPFEPRERDYAVALSFCAFAMWIAFGTIQIHQWISQKKAGNLAALGAIVIGLLAPVLMGSQGWDDHNRSQRRMARATGLAYLESCEPHAILFTQGDNDTYPLWYLQETEGVRDDVRVVNLSLLAVDWYINQLRNKMNNSDALKLSFDEASIRGESRNQIGIVDKPDYVAKYGTDLATALKFVREGPQAQLRGYKVNYLPTRNLSVPVDTNKVRANGTVLPGEKVIPRLNFKLSGDFITKDELVILDIIASNNWDRPIYFARTVTPDKTLGLSKYLRPEGMAMRLVPASNVKINPELTYSHIMKRWDWGNADKKVFHLEETGMRTAAMLRSTILGELAVPLINEAEELRRSARGADSLNQISMADQKLALAERLVDTSLIVFPERVVPIVEVADAYNYARLYYEIGNKEKGLKFAQHFLFTLESDLAYLAELDPIARARAETGGHVLQTYATVDEKQWPTAIRQLAEDFGSIRQLLFLVQQSGDTAGLRSLNEQFRAVEGRVGLYCPYELPGDSRAEP